MASLTEQTPLIRNGGDDTPREGKTLGVSYALGLFCGIVFMALCLGSFVLGDYMDLDIFPDNEVHSTQQPSEPSQTQDLPPAATQPYIATQFISFTINTLGGLESHGECEGADVDDNGVCYLGNRNSTEDVLHRLELVKKVLYRIKEDAFAEYPDIEHADNVLKIIVFPEFFWRGPKGAYSIDELLNDGDLDMVSSTLREEIVDDFFGDCLFVFGTVIATRTNDEVEQLSANEVEYYNFALVEAGGSRNANKNSFVITKKYISGADFLSRAKLPNPAEDHLHDYAQFDSELEKVLEERNTTLVTDNVIDLEGLRIGIEICLDHRVGSLWNELRTQYKPLVDVLIITSAGMAIERGPNPIVPGGVVYLSDGEASSAACMRTTDANMPFHSEMVCRGDVGGLKHIPIGGPGYSSFFELASCWDMKKTELLKGYYSLYQTQGCAYTLKTYDIDVMDEFKDYPPSIEIYPVVDLPESAYSSDAYGF